MKKYEGGAWKKMVMIPLGRCEYKFLVDGQWMLDPNNDQKCSNCNNSRWPYNLLIIKEIQGTTFVNYATKLEL